MGDVRLSRTRRSLNHHSDEPTSRSPRWSSTSPISATWRARTVTSTGRTRSSIRISAQKPKFMTRRDGSRSRVDFMLKPSPSGMDGGATSPSSAERRYSTSRCCKKTLAYAQGTQGRRSWASAGANSASRPTPRSCRPEVIRVAGIDNDSRGHDLDRRPEGRHRTSLRVFNNGMGSVRASCSPRSRSCSEAPHGPDPSAHV